MINITNKYLARKSGNEYIEDSTGQYRIIEFTIPDITESSVMNRAIITPMPIYENEFTITMEYEWQVKLGDLWASFNGENGKLKTRASKFEYINSTTKEVVTEEEALEDGEFKDGYTTSFYDVMHNITLSGDGLIGAMLPIADFYVEFHFNSKVLPKLNVQ